MGNFQEASQLFKEGNIQKALPILKIIVETEPENKEAKYILGVSHFRMQDFIEAEKHFRELVSIDSNYHRGHYYLGLSLERQGRLKDALIQYRFAQIVKPDFEEANKKIRELEQSIKVATPKPSNPPTPNVLSPQKTGSALQQNLGADLLKDPGELVLTSKRRVKSYSFSFILACLLTVSVVGIPLALLIFLVIYLKAKNTIYDFYERRIDFKSGVITKQALSLFLYQVEDATLTRSTSNLITGDSVINLHTSGLTGTEGATFKITGVGNHKEMEELFKRIRDDAISQRRTMKNFFV